MDLLTAARAVVSAFDDGDDLARQSAVVAMAELLPEDDDSDLAVAAANAEFCYGITDDIRPELLADLRAAIDRGV